MSLLDLIKDKPPVVPDDDALWPPPNRKAEFSSSTKSAPFLTTSPLFPAKRKPSLREFLNPNYRDKPEEKKKDPISEPNDLLLAIEKNNSSNNLSKTDFDLQRKVRQKNSNIIYNVGEKRPQKAVKVTEEKQAISLHKNRDSENSGSLENKKDKNFQNMISAEKLDIVQEDIVIGVDSSDIVPESNVFLDDTTKQEMSDLVDSDVTSVKGQEKKLFGSLENEEFSAVVHADTTSSASKRKVSETKSGINHEESAKTAKKTLDTEKQSDNSYSNGYLCALIDKTSNSKRKISEFESVITDKESKKVRRISQDDSSSPTSVVNKPSADAHERTELQLNLNVKADDEGSTLSNDIEEAGKNDHVHIEKGPLVSSDCHTTHSDKEEKTDTANIVQELPCKADEGSMQTNEVEESVVTGHVVEGLSAKNDIHTTHNNDEQERKLDTADTTQDLPCKVDDGSTQNNEVKKSMDKEHVEKGLSMKSDNNNALKRTLDTGNTVQGLHLKADEGYMENNADVSMDTEHEGKEIHLTTTEAVMDNDTCKVQHHKELVLQNDAVCLVQKKDDLQDKQQEVHELPTTGAFTSRTKLNGTAINITEKREPLKPGKRQDDQRQSSLNADCSTESKIQLFKDSPKNMFNIPKINPQDIKPQTTIQQRIFTTDSSESSSTEAEASETDVKRTSNQSQSFKEVHSTNKLLKKDSTEINSDSQLQSTVDNKNINHEDVPTTLSESQILKKTITDSTSDSEDDNSNDKDNEDDDDDDDEGQDCKLEADDESIEVLVFNDSDDDSDGLEDGELVDEESTDESQESEESIETVERDNFASFPGMDEKAEDKNRGADARMPTKGSKRKKEWKTYRLPKQYNTSTKPKSFPYKKGTTGNPSTRKSFPKPVRNLNASTTRRSESKNRKPLEDMQDPTQEESSLLSTLTGTSVKDVTVAASENELIQKKTRGGKISAKKRKKSQRKWNELQARRAEWERRRQENWTEPMPKPVCTFYLNGSCKKGDDCQFRHEETPAKKPYLCKYYVSGVCDMGDSCLYQHSTYPCKHFHLGSLGCSSGNHCKFSHDEPTPDTQVLFDQLFADEKNNLVSDDVDEGIKTELPSTSPEKHNPYSVRYGPVDEEECKGSGSGVMEGGIQVKKEPPDCEEASEADPCLTPSYVVPGMYTS